MVGKVMKNKKIFVIILILLLLFGFVIFIRNNIYVFTYVNPLNNTEVYPYISNITKKIDCVLYKTQRMVNNNALSIKTLYTDAYGAGFTKNNLTTKDLNYEAGIYLGKFENSEKGAKDILLAIKIYQTFLISNFENSDIHIQVTKLNNKKDDLSIVINSLKNKDKNYNVSYKNKTYTIPEGNIAIPQTDYKINLYTDKIVYSKEQRQILQKLNLNIIFYADIISDNTAKRFKIIELTPEGLILQNSLLDYQVFTNLKPLSYLSQCLKTINEDDYLKFMLNTNTKDNAASIIANVVKDTATLSSVVQMDVAKEIYSNVDTAMANKSVIFLDDYYMANEVLKSILSTPTFAKSFEKEITAHVKDMEKILADMINESSMTYSELKPLFAYQSDINNNIKNLNKLKITVQENSKQLDNYINTLISNKTNNKFVAYSLYIQKIKENPSIQKSLKANISKLKNQYHIRIKAGLIR